MTVYGVEYRTSASVYVYVEAENEEQAQEKAEKIFESKTPQICAQCANAWGNSWQLGIDMAEDWEPGETYEAEGHDPMQASDDE